MASKEIIRTRDLVLRPWLPEDAAALASLAQDPAVREATGLPEVPGPDDVAAALDDLAGEPEVFAVTLAQEPAAGPVGSVALRVGGLSGYDIDEDEGVVDFWAGPRLRTSGGLPQAIRALTDYAFEDLGLEDVSYAVDGGTERMTRPAWEASRESDPTREDFVARQQAEADRLDAGLPAIAYVRSGGQTGADRGGLDAARAAGVPIRGWCPKGGLAEDCPRSPGVLALYPELVETPSDQYVQRTAWNVRDAHATLVVAPAGIEPGSGTEMTVRLAVSYGRPVLVVAGEEDEAQVRSWLAGVGRGITLNVAGPRESKLPGTYEATRALVSRLLS